MGTCRRWPPWRHRWDKGSRSRPTKGLSAVSPARHNCPTGFGDRVTFSTVNNGVQHPRVPLQRLHTRQKKSYLSQLSLQRLPRQDFTFFPVFSPKTPFGGARSPPSPNPRQAALRAGGGGESSERGADVTAGGAGGGGWGKPRIVTSQGRGRG